MNDATATPPASQEARPFALRAVTILIASVVALSFLFGLGNVWALGIRLGVPTYIAPLVAPTVDLSVVALLVATRQLALTGASREQIRPAQHLLIFCSLVTLALNTAEPIIEGHYGRAAFDAVDCCLLIGWSHIGPDLLQALQRTASSREQASTPALQDRTLDAAGHARQPDPPAPGHSMPRPREAAKGRHNEQQERASEQTLLKQARVEDALHWRTHRRPISAEALRKRLRIGARTARRLVVQLRTDSRPRPDSAAEADQDEDSFKIQPTTAGPTRTGSPSSSARPSTRSKRSSRRAPATRPTRKPTSSPFTAYPASWSSTRRVTAIEVEHPAGGPVGRRRPVGAVRVPGSRRGTRNCRTRRLPFCTRRRDCPIADRTLPRQRNSIEENARSAGLQ